MNFQPVIISFHIAFDIHFSRDSPGSVPGGGAGASPASVWEWSFCKLDLDRLLNFFDAESLDLAGLERSTESTAQLLAVFLTCFCNACVPPRSLCGFLRCPTTIADFRLQCLSLRRRYQCATRGARLSFEVLREHFILARKVRDYDIPEEVLG